MNVNDVNLNLWSRSLAGGRAVLVWAMEEFFEAVFSPPLPFNSVVDITLSGIDTIEPLIRLTILSARAIFGLVETSLETQL